MLLINQAAVSVSSYQHHKSFAMIVESVTGTGDTRGTLELNCPSLTQSAPHHHVCSVCSTAEREREAESAASQSFRQNGNIKTNDQD